MTQPPSPRTSRAAGTAVRAVVALCLVALQLVTALHFALVPHGFGAGLTGFVHVHAARGVRSSSAQRVLGELDARSPAIESGGASCASDSCPIGFAGHHSVLLGSSAASSLLAVALAPAPTGSSLAPPARKRALLSAPKTSPPV